MTIGIKVRDSKIITNKTKAYIHEIYIYDLYLDLVIKSNGKEVVLDEDELKEALNNRDISKDDFNMAYKTMKKIQDKYRNNLGELIELTNKLYKEL